MIFLQSAVSLSGIAGNTFSGIARGASTFFWGLGIMIVLIIFGFFGWKKFQSMAFYKTPVTLTILLENGLEKSRYDLRGGAFWNKGVRDFKIKIPKSKPHVLGYMPDFSKADGDGRIRFTTTGDRTIWQQYESKWKLKGKNIDGDGNAFEYDLIDTPVPRETKQITINSIKNWRDTIDKAKLTAFGIAIGGFIIMVVAHLISLFIQTKIRCGID